MTTSINGSLCSTCKARSAELAATTSCPRSSSTAVVLAATILSSSTSSTRHEVPLTIRRGAAPAPFDATGSETGSHNSTVVPAPGSLAIRIAPPDCATRPSTIDSPSPVPWPALLVVKNGSAARFRVASSMPIPVSLTSMCTWLGWITWVRSVSVPPCGIASTAFRMRFVRASRISLSTPAIAGKSAAGSHCMRMTMPRSCGMALQRARVRSMTCPRREFRSTEVWASCGSRRR